MLKQRILTAIVLLSVFLGALFFAPQPLWLLLAVLVCAGGAWEWGGLAGFKRSGRAALAVGFGLLCSGLGLWWGLHLDEPESVAHGALIVCYAVSVVFWLLLVPLWLRFKWRMSEPFTAVLTGLVVLLPAALALAYLRLAGGPAGLLLVMLLVWTADTAAYFTGRAFGRHKLAPAISPGKTWEGAAGAACGVILIGFAVFLCRNADVSTAGMLALLLILALLTVTSIEGDLFESLLKRQAGIKDSGTLLPGHGGILDRIDSLTSVLPLAALGFAIISAYRISI